MEELLEDCDQLLDRKTERDLQNALNSELQRRFRAIAQIAGLMIAAFQFCKSTGQPQISASLLFDVANRQELQNRLLLQAQREVLDDQLELSGSILSGTS